MSAGTPAKDFVLLNGKRPVCKRDSFERTGCARQKLVSDMGTE